MKVAYLTSYYPAVSHSFVRREVVALREQGVDVKTFSIQGADGIDVLAPADLSEARTTRSILGRSRVSVARDLVRAFIAHPRVIAGVAFEAVRSVHGAKRRLWQLFYVVEASILQSWVAEWGGAHVHAHFGNAPVDVACWTKELGNRLGGTWTWSFTMHGPTELYAVQEHDLPAKLADADFVACISDFCRSQMMVFSDPSDWPKFEVVHCGIVPDEFRTTRVAGNGVLRIICLGRLVPEKGQAILLRAVGVLSEMGVAAHVDFVGDGRSRSSLEHEAREAGIDASFLGPVGHDAVPELLSNADVFCLPSFAEGLPVVLMEAMAAGLPVVTTRIAGVQELVEEGVSGFVVAPGRVDLLAAALAELARDPERARSMGKAGRVKVQEAFDVEDSAKQLKCAFTRLARSPRTIS